MTARVATSRDLAEAWCVLLAYELAAVADVVAWADEVVLAEPLPHWSFCELSLMGRALTPDVAHALGEVPGEAAPEAVQAVVVRWMRARLDDGRLALAQVTRTLFVMACSEALPHPSLATVAFWADEERSLVEDGMSHTTLDEVRRSVREALLVAERELDAT